jgi:UDP-N-acetylmuramoylalanine--D-glutamate ligase
METGSLVERGGERRVSVESVEGARVVVVGGATSGVAAAELLVERGARVLVTDLQPALPDEARLRAAGVELHLGGHDPDRIADADLIVLSPGVDPRGDPVRPALERARQRGVPVVSEIELAARWLTGRIVAITGTKGKSTTATLVGRLFEQAGFAATVGGNIGTPLSAQVALTGPHVWHVVEVSSFQLELTERFHPTIAVLLNLSPDHLDRHGSLEAYRAAKARIFANQEAHDWAVFNADDAEASALAQLARARRWPFALEAPIPAGVTLVGDVVVARTPEGDRPLVSRDAVRVAGRHLLSDALAALAVATLAGVPPDAMVRALAAFEGLEHVLEPVADIGGVRFVNDSKATNVAAARAAIESFEGPLVVIVGGQFKGGDLRDLAPALVARQAQVVAIGAARPLIQAALADTVPVHEAADLGEAVRLAFRLAAPQGVVLLAPACASFDMFADYRARGRAFKEEVYRLAAETRR